MKHTSVHAAAGAGLSGSALAIDLASIVTKVESVVEAQLLPLGAVIGDVHGGLTFTDAVAAALEDRSSGGWQEIRSREGKIWTIIVLNR